MSAHLGSSAGVGSDPRGRPARRVRLPGIRLLLNTLCCLVAAVGAAACGSSASSSSSTTTAAAASATSSSTSSSTTAASTASPSAPGASGACRQLLAKSSPAVTAGATPKLATLEQKALQAVRASAFQFTGRTCVAVAGPAQVITLNGVASLSPTLTIDGHETIGGRGLEVRFIGSNIYIDVPEIAAHDGGRPWLAASLTRLSSLSGVDFTQLLDQIRQLSPNVKSPLLKAAADFHALGRATIAGHTVYVYRGNFAPSDLTKLGLPAKLAQQTAGKLAQLGATNEQVTSYVNAQGVAVLTVAAIFKRSDLLTVTINSSSRLGHAIAVSPPPASKTIAYSKLTG